MKIIKSIKEWHRIEKLSGVKTSTQVMGCVVLALIIFYAIALSIHQIDAKEKQKRDKQFSYNCALNKGIAVIDLDKKLRCAPTFSAVKAKS